MAFSSDTQPTRRAFGARIEVSLDAAVTGLTLCRRWEPNDPEQKANLETAFKMIKLWALHADKIINGDAKK